MARLGEVLGGIAAVTTIAVGWVKLLAYRRRSGSSWLDLLREGPKDPA